MLRLNRSQKELIRRASRVTSGNLFSELRRHWANNKWIGKTNRYCTDCTNRIERDTKNGRSVNHAHLAQYIAASVLLHTADGWGFLGRAVDCHARGDFRTSRHLAYYAELRAAMALSAFEGIGIFNKKHFIVDDSRECHKIQGIGTHQIAWLILDHWSDLKRSSNLITSVIKPGGIGLGEWTDRFGGGGTVKTVGNRWLKTWGIDLRKLGKDRNARNEASYRPSKMVASETLPFDQLLNFITEFWRILEPAPQNAFDLLDKFLLRRCLAELFKAITGLRPRNDMAAYCKRVSKMLDDVLGQQTVKEKWFRFLTWEIEPEDSQILIEALGNDRQESPRHHLQVIARGSLLLRLSTGACDLLLSSAGADRTMIQFWLKSVGEEIGMWETDSEPEELADLWSDIQLAAEETKAWYANKDLPNLVKWRKEQGSQITVFGNCERIGLWGLGI